MTSFKIPCSVLVVIHTGDGEVLLLERADQPGFWQSVTGSLDHADEPLADAALREVMEETGIDGRQHHLTDWRMQNAYDIYPQWLWRYAPGVSRNIEHVFGLRLTGRVPVRLAPREHLSYCWLPIDEAAEKCFSPSNAAAIRELPRRL